MQRIPLVAMGCPTFTPKLPLSLWQSPPHLIHLSLDRFHSPPQTAPRSNQPFCNSTFSRQTLTDIFFRWQACKNTCLCSIVLTIVTRLIMTVTDVICSCLQPGIPLIHCTRTLFNCHYALYVDQTSITDYHQPNTHWFLHCFLMNTEDLFFEATFNVWFLINYSPQSSIFINLCGCALEVIIIGSSRSFAVHSCYYCAVLQWKTPGTYLEDDLNRDEGQPPLAPPQVYEMYDLHTFHSLEGLLNECKKRQKIDAKCWMPVYQLCRNAVLLLLPGIPFLFTFYFYYVIQCFNAVGWAAGKAFSL